MKIPSINKLSGLQVFQILRFGAPFIISVILVRLLDQQIIGLYESLVLIGTSFTFFWVSGIINTFIPYYHAAEEEKRSLLIFNVFIFLSALSLIVFLCLVALKSLLFPAIPGIGNLYEYYLLFSLFNAPSFLMEYLLLVKNKPKAIIAYGVLVFSLQILSLTVPLALGFSIDAAVGVMAVFSFLKYGFVAFYVLRTTKAQLAFDLLKAFASKALPAMGSLLVGGSMIYIDSYIVLHFYDKPTYAIYRYGAQEMPLVLLMANALSNVYSGDIAQAFKNKNIISGLDGMKRSSLRLMHTLFPVTILLMLASRFLFTHVYSHGFLLSAPIFNVFLLLTISRLVFPQTVMTGMLKNRELLYMNAAEWLINLVLDLILLHYFGMIGIAWATVIAYFSLMIMQMIYLKFKGFEFSDYIPLRSWGIYTGLVFIAFACSQVLLQ